MVSWVLTMVLLVGIVFSSAVESASAVLVSTGAEKVVVSVPAPAVVVLDLEVEGSTGGVASDGNRQTDSLYY